MSHLSVIGGCSGDCLGSGRDRVQHKSLDRDILIFRELHLCPLLVKIGLEMRSSAFVLFLHSLDDTRE